MALLMRRIVLAAILLGVAISTAARAQDAPARIKDLVHQEGEVTRRLVGYGLVVGLDGTGDYSWGGLSSHNATVHSVVNMLRRFNLEVPPEYLRLRNVAAVVVTAEVSPYLRSGGHFEVSVSALGDAVSLDGGVLWMTPLVSDPGGPAVATAQGPLLTAQPKDRTHPWYQPDNSGRIPDGGLLEIDPPAVQTSPRLLLNDPDRTTATRIAQVINTALGDGTAKSADPGSVDLNLSGDDMPLKLATIDTLVLVADQPARVVIHSREGLVVAGGNIMVGAAVIHHAGLTLEIGAPPDAAGTRGVIALDRGAHVSDIAAGLHAAGAAPDEFTAIFEALRDAGALRAQVVIR